MAKNKVIFKLDKNDSIVKDGHVLYRLICDGYKEEPQYEPKVKKGDKGGYIENLKQISTAVDHAGALAWVDKNSFVYGSSKVNQMYVLNSTIKNSTINGFGRYRNIHIQNSTVSDSVIAGEVVIDDATISHSNVKKFHVRNSTITNSDIASKYNCTIYDANLSNINCLKYPHHITGEFANELTQHDFYVDGRHVRICANNDQIIVTDSDSSIVKTGAMAPYEFVQLVKSHVKPDILTMLEQYVQMT